MRGSKLAPVLSLVRQGISLERAFGLHSLESLARIAEVVEESVYEAGSLERTDQGLRFALSNPPLRLGAFRAVRLFLDRQPVAPSGVRFRAGPGEAWRAASTVSRENPLVLVPGRRVEFAADSSARAPGSVNVRLELESVAVPPLVWFEFEDTPRGG